VNSDERVAKNESLFREANERIKEISDTFVDLDPSPVQFVCECGRAGCTEPIMLRLAEYEHVRATPTRFALVRGHEDTERERVTEEHEEYVVVEKIGQAAEAAADLDPRS
jgi:hypothetical protein